TACWEKKRTRTNCKLKGSPTLFCTAESSKAAPSTTAWPRCGRWSPSHDRWRVGSGFGWQMSAAAYRQRPTRNTARSRSVEIGIFAKTFIRPTVGETLDAVAAHGVRTVQFNLSCVG